MIANLRIETAWKNKSFIKKVYYTPPFKATEITEDKIPGILQVMLMNVSPGVLDGDRYQLEFKIGEGSSLELHTQAYQRVFTMKGSAFQSMHVTIEKNASLFFLPHPVVPHKGSDFTTENSIFLSEGAELLWSEILTCGRKGCGEAFSFSKYHSLTTIYYGGRLVVKENLLVRPAMVSVHSIGQWEGYTHQGSMIYWNEKISMPVLMQEIRKLFSNEPGICLGISSLPANGLLIRILGHKAEQLFDLFKVAASFIAQLKRLKEKKEHSPTAIHAN